MMHYESMYVRMVSRFSYRTLASLPLLRVKPFESALSTRLPLRKRDLSSFSLLRGLLFNLFLVLHILYLLLLGIR